MAAIDKSKYELYVTLAGGGIRCLRCTAQSSRTKKQCGRPALNSSRTQKCQFHSGRPHKADVLQRISEANLLHGETTKAAKQQYRDGSVLIHELEDAIHFLKMGAGTRIRGRKPEGYKGVYGDDDVMRMVIERYLHMLSPLK